MRFPFFVFIIFHYIKGKKRCFNEKLNNLKLKQTISMPSIITTISKGFKIPFKLNLIMH